VNPSKACSTAKVTRLESANFGSMPVTGRHSASCGDFFQQVIGLYVQSGSEGAQVVRRPMILGILCHLRIHPRNRSPS
jgi:hypothetical protein